jgi:DNA-binding response OmpR family regulator
LIGKTNIILIADHNLERLHMTSKRLKQEGYQVLAATGKEQAIAMAMNKQPDIVIVEATLDGSISDTGQEIKKFNSVHALKLVIKGEIASENEFIELSNLGVDDFIPPTVGLEELVGRIKRVEVGKSRLEDPGTRRSVGVKRKILLVEDDHMNQQYMCTLLESMGYHLEVCGDGKEALKKITDTVYDLVITDLNVPGLSGIELTKEIRIGQLTMPVIGVSGHSERSLIKRSLDAGMNNYLVKPFDAAQLGEVLEEHFGPSAAKSKAVLKMAKGKYDYGALLKLCDGDNKLLYKWVDDYLELVRRSIITISGAINAGMAADDNRIFHDLLNKASYFGTRDLGLYIKEFSVVKDQNPKREIIFRFYQKIVAELKEVENFYGQALDNVKCGKLL